MASSSSSSGYSGLSHPLVPQFSGEDYDHWSIMMKTLFRCNSLWEVVEKGFSEEEAKVEGNRQKDAHALFLIQQGVQRSLFSRIAAANTAKEAWDALKIQFQGSPKIMALRIQALRQSFENLHKKENEGIQAYIARVTDLVNQMKGLGDQISESLVVGKVLRSLGPKYNFIVAAIGEAKDLTKLTMDELAGSLQAHENLLLSQDDVSVEKVLVSNSEDKTLIMKGESTSSEDWHFNRGRGRSFSRGRGRNYGRSRGRFSNDVTTESNQRSNSADQSDRNIGESSSSSGGKNTDAEFGGLFMVHTEIRSPHPSIWLLDSGCSSHMTGRKELFFKLDENQRHVVKLGDNKEMQVAGKGSVAVTTQIGETKLIHNVQYVPNLAHNLLSVGQLIANGYQLIFEKRRCRIIDEKAGIQLMVVNQNKNNLFPIEFSQIGQTNAAISDSGNSQLWHDRYGHLNFESLQVLHHKQMVIGLPEVKQFSCCESCIFGKLSRQPFYSGKSWRAKERLQLVHSDLCGPMQVDSLGGSRDVRFDEQKHWEWESENSSSHRIISSSVPIVGNSSGNNLADGSRVIDTTRESDSTSNSDTEVQSASSNDQSEDSPPAKIRTLREIYENCSFVLNVSDPVTYEEAQRIPEWREAMNAELSSINRNHTWELISPPPGKKIIGVKWIFKRKYKANGEVDKCKARLVAKGYTQEYGVDYEEIFAPVARMDTIRLLIALAAHKNWAIFQLDIKSAFLNGEIEEEVYVEQPKGYVIQGKEQMVYKLHKALYGLKQAPRAWYGKFDAYLQQQGFKRSMTEHTLYTKVGEKEEMIIVCIYVDDVIYMSPSLEMMNRFKDDMKRNFEMTDLGLLSYFLGLEIKQDTLGIHVSQKKYIEDLLKSFNMFNCKPSSTPLCTNAKLNLFDEAEPADITAYRKLIGKLIYVTQSRPDIAFSVNLLSRFMHQPTRNQYGAAKQILRYLAGSMDFGIYYERGNECKLMCYSDSDWGGNLVDRKSTTGAAFTFGSGIVSWISKKQEIVTLSSTEAEYVALCGACCQSLWLKRILSDCGEIFDDPIPIWCDNRSCIAIAKNPVLHGRTKHIDVKYHFIRELVTENSIQLLFCNTEEQLADIFTKCVDAKKLYKFRDLLGICSLQSRGRNVGVTEDIKDTEIQNELKKLKK
ncbi:uncharacterized protein LOC120274764 [Dioscorea cayenensis subsp. rotundata]|uniref:Uncharacterized protein LOC120274764 n=1 Tax=Dioscorea cayennensis subsp. rotundata TaxID=55577 RepID=A0AB40CBF5_DIOCR|nr:uncharacterized protein LOC120274764 [Dioscorea cayenensis subsp. rotundata]